MTLSIPNYLRAANIQDTSLRYEWDDWRTLPALKTPDEGLVARLKCVSQRAVLAFACGTAEWIVYRFAKLCDVQPPWDYIEAAWAMIVDVRYCGYGSATGWQEYSQKGWDGPIRRPIRNALRFLDIASEQMMSESCTDPATLTAMISALARYVMTDPAPYAKWCGLVLERFDSLYPRHSQDPLGDVVPRRAVDPEVDFRVDETETLINQFLASLAYPSNIFLITPEGMLEHFDGEEDFKGEPYLFNIETDRKVRRESKDHPHH